MYRNGEKIDSRELCNIMINEEYELYKDHDSCGRVYFMCGGEIPTVYISTSSGDTKINLEKDKHYNESGYITIANCDGTINYEGYLKSISGRGNDTWNSYKKGWSLTLDKQASILEMKESTNWVLIGNARDNTDGIRNLAAYSMAEAIGLAYTSKLQLVDLFIDNNYVGLYTIAERIEQSEEYMNIGNLDEYNNISNRVVLDANKIEQKSIDNNDDGISEISWSEITSPEDISGGYILERNFGYKLEDKKYIFSTTGGEYFVIRYPSVVSKEEVKYITDIFQSVENALFSKDYIDERTGKKLTDLIDIESFAKKYLIDETTKNEGAGSTSCYYYKKQGDDLLYAGPVWDYDKSFGLFEGFTNPDGLTYSSTHPQSPTYWYKELYENDDAYKLIQKYYCELCRPYLLDLNNYLIDEWSKQIENSYYMNWVRWKYQILKYGNNENRHENFFDDIANPTKYMKEWILKRIVYLDSVWLNNE